MDEQTLDRHSVTCYFCHELVDERECSSADEYNDNDGGSICEPCIEDKQEQARRDEKNGLYPEKMDDSN